MKIRVYNKNGVTKVTKITETGIEQNMFSNVENGKYIEINVIPYIGLDTTLHKIPNDFMNQPVNVYGSTCFYKNGMLEEAYDGFGFKDSNGNITWYEGYDGKNDDCHKTTIIPYGKGCDLSELF